MRDHWSVSMWVLLVCLAILFVVVLPYLFSHQPGEPRGFWHLEPVH